MDSLIERAHRGLASEAELERLASWRAADPAHEQQYRDVVKILEAAARLRTELSSATPPPALAARLAERAAPPAGTLRRGGVHTAAREAARWRRVVPWTIAAAAVLLLAVNLFLADPFGAGPVAHAAEVVTGTGEIATIQLGDGSVVRLAPDSRLRLGGSDARTVTLDGRAYFSIAHMEGGQPFRVHTRAADAIVLGTRFEILTSDDELRLIVVEGRVALEAPDNRVEVGAGEVAAVANRVASRPEAVDDPDRVLRWAGRFLAFQATPLADAARDIEAMYDVRIAITDPTLTRQTVTAVFTGQELQAVLTVICEIVNARCVVRGDDVTISPR